MNGYMLCSTTTMQLGYQVYLLPSPVDKCNVLKDNINIEDLH